ncbi:MAG: NFACT family protein [Synergistales bacterium]|nr:NFACT family protein [Synergistales bacterium]
MALGPELVTQWCRELEGWFPKPRKVQRLRGGDRWVVLSFAAERHLLLSWDTEGYGIAALRPEMIEKLERHTPGVSPLLPALRAHLLSTLCTGSRQLQQDRVVELHFRKTIGAGFQSSLYLILEATGRYSNLILLDGSRNIIESAKHVYPDINRYRSIHPGIGYTPPPPFEGTLLENITEDSPEAFLSLNGFGKPLLRHIRAYWSAFSAERWYVALQRTSDPETPSDALFPQLLPQGYLTAFPVLLPQARVEENDALSESSEITAVPMLDRRARAYRQELLLYFNRRHRAVEQQRKGLANKRRRFQQSETLRLYGELLLAHSKQIPRGVREVALPDWNQPGNEVCIPIDVQKSAVENAQGYFRKYKKHKKYGKVLEEEEQRLNSEITAVEEEASVVQALEDPDPLLSLRREVFGAAAGTKKGSKRRGKNKELPPHLSYEFPWGKLYIGLSAKGNRYVTFSLANPEDIWAHAKEIPGAHVVVKPHGKDLPAGAVELACTLAAHYSKARESTHVPVDYTLRKHVRHIPGGGPAYVRYEDYSTLITEPTGALKMLEDAQSAPEGGAI